MSCGLMPSSAPPGPGCIGRPSITYRGWVLAARDVWPRIWIAMPPSAVRVINAPGTFAARVFSIASLPARSRSSPVTVVPAIGGEGEGVGLSNGPRGAALLEAHPERSPTNKAQDRATRGVNDAI